jgi:hypothetical protein
MSLISESNKVILDHVEVFWAVTLGSVVVGYQSFVGPSCLQPASGCCGTITRKRWYPITTLQGVTTQKTATWISTAMKTSNTAILPHLTLTKTKIHESQISTMTRVKNMEIVDRCATVWRHKHETYNKNPLSSPAPALSSHVRSVGLNGERSLLIYTARGSAIVILKLLFCFASYI